MDECWEDDGEEEGDSECSEQKFCTRYLVHTSCCCFKG